MFEALLPVPPTANNLFPTGRSGKRFISSKYRDWKAEAEKALASQSAPKPGMAGRLYAEYRYSFPDKRRRDIANFEKAVTDFLKEYGVFEDDSQIDELKLVRDPLGSNGVFVTIWEAQEV